MPLLNGVSIQFLGRHRVVIYIFRYVDGLLQRILLLCVIVIWHVNTFVCVVGGCRSAGNIDGISTVVSSVLIILGILYIIFCN